MSTTSAAPQRDCRARTGKECGRNAGHSAQLASNPGPSPWLEMPSGPDQLNRRFRFSLRMKHFWPFDRVPRSLWPRAVNAARRVRELPLAGNVGVTVRSIGRSSSRSWRPTDSMSTCSAMTLSCVNGGGVSRIWHESATACQAPLICRQRRTSRTECPIPLRRGR